MSGSDVDQSSDDFLELTADNAAIEAFVARENRRSADVLIDETSYADRRVIEEMLEDENKLIHTAQRGDWLYTFARTKTNPRGVWQRIPATLLPTAGAPWECVFDLDAFSNAEERIWHWRGTVTAPFDPDRVLIALSDGGSDRWRFIEFDCARKAVVDGGFDLPPQKANVCWLGHDDIIVCTSGDGCATRAGWPRVSKRLKRGNPLKDAPVLFEGDWSDVGIWAYAFIRRIDEPLIVFRRVYELGKMAMTFVTPGKQTWRADAPHDAYIAASHTHYVYNPRDEADPLCGALVLCTHGATRRNVPEHHIVFRPTDRRVLDWRGVKFLDEWLLFTVEEDLKPTIFAQDLSKPDAPPERISLPEDCDVIDITDRHAEPQAGDQSLQLYCQSLQHPPAVYWFDLCHGPSGVVYTPIDREPDRFDAEAVTVDLLEAVSDDGTPIPYRLVTPRTAGPPGDRPVLMYGYGGYGTSMVPRYLGFWGKLWLERGGAYVLAHTRGGSELGPTWHKSAMRENRHRAFEDFAAIARDLVARGISRPARIACHGASNGGLLAAVMLTRYPHLFGAIWSAMPLTDMLRFHHFDAGRAWIDEFGDPDRPDDRTWLKAYSPFHNVAPAAEIPYPPTYFETSKGDDRVDPSHAMRMTAKLQALGHDPLFHRFDDGGHAGGGATTERARELAMGLAFLRKTVL